MDKILFVLFSFLVISGSAQIDKNNPRVGEHKDAIFLPENGQWYNIETGPKSFINKKKLTLLHFWDPASIESQGIVQSLNEWALKHREYEVFTVLDTDHASQRTPETVIDLIIRNEIRHPVYVPDSIGEVPGLDYNSAPVMAVLNQDAELYSKLIGNVEIQSAWDDLDSLGQQELLTGGIDRIFRGRKYMPDRAPKSALGNLSHICASERHVTLYITEHKKHRILISDIDGQLNRKIGVGKRGWVDGRAAIARFNGPSGMALDEANQILYVADTYNHVIRQVDLRYELVSTILGTGEQGLIPPTEVMGSTGRLSYPMDLELRGGKLYIAMAGYNQIWEMDLTTTKARPIAGDGKKGSEDGSKLESKLNAPSSLTFDTDGSLFFVEPESGRVREMTTKGKIKTIYEPKGDTLVGDMQHPKGILSFNDELYITDSFNNRICRMSRKEIDVVAGTGERGQAGGKGAKSTFYSPGSMAYMGGEFYVIDEGNNVIRTVDSKSFKVDTYELTSMHGATNYEQAITDGEDIYLSTVATGDGTNVVSFTVSLGDGYKVLDWGRNEAAMDDMKDYNSMEYQDVENGLVEFTALGDYDNVNIQFELYVTYTHADKPGSIFYQSAMVVIPLEYEPGGNTNHSVEYELTKDFIQLQ